MVHACAMTRFGRARRDGDRRRFRDRCGMREAAGRVRCDRPWPGCANSKTTQDEETVEHAQEILNVMSRYCRAVDDRDWDGLAQLLADDVRFEMGDVTESRDELFAYMQANLWPAGRHLYMNPAVT